MCVPFGLEIHLLVSEMADRQLFLAMSFVMIKAAHSPDVTARNLAEYLTAKLYKRMPQWGKKEMRPLAMPYKKF